MFSEMWNDIEVSAPIRSVQELIKHYSDHPLSPGNPLKLLTTKERAHVRAEIEGIPVARLGFKRDSGILDKPHVAQAIDGILEKAGLSDKKLAARLSKIIFRGTGANADNTAHNAIRTAWQLKGKFAPERHEVLHRSDLENLPEAQLDKIIEAGVKEFTIFRAKIHAGNPTPSDPGQDSPAA